MNLKIRVLSAALFLWPAAAVAGGLAEKVQETYRKTDNFRADFVQKTKVEVLDREVEEGGTLVFAKPGKFSIRYAGKNERHYLSDGRTLWIYRPRDREVEVIENVEDVVAKEALAFLGGLAEMGKEFKVSEGKDGLTLVPRRKTAPFMKLALTIDPQTHLVSAVDLFPKSGNRSRYTFRSVRTNEAVKDSDFAFKKAGVKEIKSLTSPP